MSSKINESIIILFLYLLSIFLCIIFNFKDMDKFIIGFYIGVFVMCSLDEIRDIIKWFAYDRY